MYFFRLATFMSSNINLSTDILQVGRVRRERGQARDRRRTSLADGRRHPTEKTESSLKSKISSILEYNHNGLPYLLFASLRLYVNIFGLVTQSLYSILPFDRDPLTNEYVNPVLRTMEYIYIYNYFEKYHIFNKILALHLLQSMLMYSRSIYRKMLNLQANRHKYKRVNVVSIDMGYLNEIFSNFSGWMRILLTLGKHECQLKKTLRSKRGQAMKRLTEQLRGSSKADRLYYFNLIEFEDCYKGLNVSVRTHLQRKEDLARRGSRGDMRISWHDYLLRFNLPGRRPFVPEPGHRMDPLELSILLMFFIFGSLLDFALFMSAVIAYLSLGGGSSKKNFNLLAGFIESLMFFLPLALNAYDCGVVAFSSLLCQSRARKLTNMLRAELKVYLSLIEAFWAEIEKYHEQSYCRGKSNLSWLAEHSCQGSAPQCELVSTNTRIRSLACIRADLWIPNPSIHKEEEQSLFEASIDNFKEHIGQEKLAQINSNLSYLLDLVDVLQHEHHDGLEHYTNYLNLNLLFTIPCLALSFTVISTFAGSAAEFYLALALFFVSCIPMAICMILGATSERSFRSVHCHLVPFMVNELSLIEIPIVRRLQKVCKFLGEKENRSFVVLGSFPLTFGSVASITGWIASGILILQKFLT